MASVKISALPAATSIASADTVAIVQGGTTKKATFGTVALGAVTATTTTIGAGAAITSSGAGGVLGSNAFNSTAFLSFVAPPATSTSAGTAGQIAYDANYFYICTATNTWARTTLATTWP